MGTIHQLVREHGREAARELVPEEDRRLVDLAAEILANPSSAFNITYSGFCLTALPHKALGDSAKWERQGHNVSLLIEPGSLPDGRGGFKQFGVPYGSRARLIMLYLQTRAIQTGCPEVELGGSMRDWMSRMGVPIGGSSYKVVRDQADRISACHLTFSWHGPDAGRGAKFSKESIVDGGIQLYEDDDAQPRLWVDTVRLSASFFKALREHPVPIWEPALKSISSRSMAIDLYVWLSYRLHSLSKPMPITWSALYAQFGAGYKNLFQFKPRLIESLKFVLAVYPDAKVTLEGDGVVLHHSPSPVPEKAPRGILR
ncbi:replication protein RepA [Azospirillum agricola]|uniref:replication protein RepA n=1 Tax=Azospirillum agricola TaxID=1720247 RepID=UPI000A0F0067|nr:replication protein RepA [Azospirillum agricola]MBP2231257.1 hypothetical protein [Azospirillum agricola]SMH62727.1 RepA protein [Azospirillum lipoferum]